MAGGYRQFVDSGNTEGPPNYPAGVTISPAITTLVGSCLALQFCLSNDNGDVTLTASDSKGNAYTKRVDAADTTSAGDERFVWFICDSATHALSTTDTITVTGAGTDYLELLFWEVTGTTGYLSGNGLYQAPVTGSSANNLNSGNLAGGSGNVFVLSCSMNTLDAGTTPYYPTVGTGLTAGGQWFKFDQLGNAYVASWGYGSFTAPGTFTAKWTSSAGSSADHYVTTAIAFGVPTGGGGGTTLTAAVGTFALAGKAVTLSSTAAFSAPNFDSTTVTFDSTVYTFDGGTSSAFSLTAAAGIFALTGEAATLQGTVAMSLTAAAGSYMLSGIGANLSAQGLSYTLLASAGTFNVAGAPSSSDLQMDVGVGTFALTGYTVQFGAVALLPVAAGYFTLAGQNAVLTTGGTPLLTASDGLFTVTGFGATFLETDQPFLVTAVTAGVYRGVDYEPGDTFYLYSNAEFSDATQNAQPNGAEYAPGWMLRANPGTPPYQAETQQPFPTFPVVDPARRFVL
jgi:hypothetical protein